MTAYNQPTVARSRLNLINGFCGENFSSLRQASSFHLTQRPINFRLKRPLHENLNICQFRVAEIENTFNQLVHISPVYLIWNFHNNFSLDLSGLRQWHSTGLQYFNLNISGGDLQGITCNKLHISPHLILHFQLLDLI